jgi:hypothetical protein
MAANKTDANDADGLAQLAEARTHRRRSSAPKLPSRWAVLAAPRQDAELTVVEVSVERARRFG